MGFWRRLLDRIRMPEMELRAPTESEIIANYEWPKDGSVEVVKPDKYHWTQPFQPDPVRAVIRYLESKYDFSSLPKPKPSKGGGVCYQDDKDKVSRRADELDKKYPLYNGMRSEKQVLAILEAQKKSRPIKKRKTKRKSPRR